MNKTVFFGTSNYCLPVLEALSKTSNLVLVVTRPDKPEGRKAIFTASATKNWANEHGIATYTPESLKKESQGRIELINILQSLKPDLAVVSDFGLIIPETIFSIPRLGTVNIHFSKLPKLRGPSPVQFKLLRGKDEAWITMFKLDNSADIPIKMDSGPIIWQEKYPIFDTETTDMLYSRLFVEVAKQIPTILNNYAKNPEALTLQNHNEATFCRFLTKEDGFIEWDILQKAMKGEEINFIDLPKIQQEALNLTSTNQQEARTMDKDATVQHIFNFYRGVTPWPGMWTIKEGNRMKVITCHLEKNLLKLDKVQYEGKGKPETFS